MALPHRQAELGHLIAGEVCNYHRVTRPVSTTSAVLTLPGNALPKHLRLSRLAERVKDLFRAKHVHPPEDSLVTVVPEVPRSTLAPSAEKKSHGGPCRGLVMTKEVRPSGLVTPSLKAVLAPDDEVVPEAPPPSLLVPLSAPLESESVEAMEVESPSLSPRCLGSSEPEKSQGNDPEGCPESTRWSRWRPLPPETVHAERSLESPFCPVLETDRVVETTAEGVTEEVSMDVVARWRHVEVVEEGKSVDYTLSKSSCSTEAFEHYSRRPSAVPTEKRVLQTNVCAMPAAQFIWGIGRPPRLPPWSLRFYKPEALPRVSVPKPVEKVEPEIEPPLAIRPPRALNQAHSKRFRATRHKRRQPELPALEVNSDGTFDFPTARRVVVEQWEEESEFLPVSLEQLMEEKLVLPNESVELIEASHHSGSHSGSRGSRSGSQNGTPRHEEMKMERVQSGPDSSKSSPTRLRLNSISDEVDRLPIGEAKSQAQHGGDSYRPCNSPTGRASEDDSTDPFCMASGD